MVDWAFAAASLWLVPAGRAEAGVLGPPRFENLVQSVDAIVIAGVGTSSNVVPEPDSIMGPIAFTDYGLSVGEVWKGSLSNRDHTIFRLFGGQLQDGRGIVGSEGPIVQTGHRYVLFLVRGTKGVWRDRWSASQDGVYEIEGGEVFGLFARGMPLHRFRGLVHDAEKSAKPRAGQPAGRLLLKLHDADRPEWPVRSLVRVQKLGAVFSIFDFAGGTVIPLSPGQRVFEFYPVGGEPKYATANVVAGRTDTLEVTLRAWLK